MSLEGREIAHATAAFATQRTNSIEIDQGAAPLELGIYGIELFVTCHTAIDRMRTVAPHVDMRPILQRLRVDLSFAEPGDRVLKPIPAARLGTSL